MARRKAPVVTLPVCEPTGDFRPWIDSRPHRCIVCAEPVREVASRDGTDWHAMDESGSLFGTAEMPPMCDCESVASLRAVTPSRWYGHAIPAAAWFGGFHTHNALGGDVVTEQPGELLMACFRMPPKKHVEWITPLDPTRLPPECCGWPMRFAPRGWNCRVNTATYVVPDFTAAPAEEAVA